MNNNFEKFVRTWKTEIEDLKPHKGQSHLLFLVVCPDDIEWSFSIEKQCQTTTLMVSGGLTGASIGHDFQFCYRSGVNDFLKECKHTHAMIVSVGMVFDMVGYSGNATGTWRQNYKEGGGRKVTPNQITPITDFFDFVENKELIKGHIIARPDKQAFLHHQHINLNVDMWKTLGCPDVYGRYDVESRSDNNYHDDYTPHYAVLEGLGRVKNFTHQERERKAFSYYKDHDSIWKDLKTADMKDYYFSRFMIRIVEAFYINNTESLKKVPEDKFDLLFSPTAGYSAEAYVDKLDFTGTVVLYDYHQKNLDIKQTIVDMNMSLDEIYMLKKVADWNMVDNTGNKPASQRIRGMGTHEELRALQLKMNEEQDVQYWLMNLIEPDYTKLLNSVRGRNVFFDASNIFGYHMSHARHTLDELVSSYKKLHEVLSQANKCWFQGTKPTKQWERTWI